MRTLLLLALLFPAPDDDKGRVVVALVDGSRLAGALQGDPLVLKTEYGEQRIPLPEVRSLRRLNEAEVVVRTDSSSATGEVARRTLDLAGDMGRVTLPLSDVRSIFWRTAPSLLADAETIALWAFDSGERTSDLIRNRALKLQDMEISADKDGVTAAARKTLDAFGEAATDDELEWSGDFTLEARFKGGAAPRGNYAVVSKNDRAGSSCDFLLYIQAGGVIHFQFVNPRGSFTFQTPAGVLKHEEWNTVAIVLQSQDQKITFYVNGKQVHQIRQPFVFATQGSPVTIGLSAAYRGGINCAERIQFVRLSKVARRAEEIVECHTLFDSPFGAIVSSAGRGFALRDGGFLRADLPRLEGMKFRTRYGTLTLSEGVPGQIHLFRHREDELPAVRKEVRALIGKLGAARVEEREDARRRLVAAGEAAVELLRERRGDADAEVRSRIEEVLKTLDETGVSARPASDIFRMGQTVLHGWLQAEAVEGISRYGTHSIPVKAIGRIVLGDRPGRDRPALRLKSGEVLQEETPKDVALDLETDFGRLSIPLRDVVRLTFDPAKDVWKVTTERLSSTGVIDGSGLKLHTPAGPITVPLSELGEIAPPGKPGP